MAEQMDLRSDGPDYVPLDTLPKDHRSFQYAEIVNAGGNFTEQVIDENRAAQGREYRLQTEGEHPVVDLRQPAGAGSGR
jgi:glycerol-3-phosphate dehydrogenase